MASSAFCIAGWAQTPESLKLLGEQLPVGDIVYSSVAELGAPCSMKKVEDILGGLSEPITVIGWSMGGMYALEIAAKFPKLVDKLVLISTCPKFIQADNNPSGIVLAEVRAMKMAVAESPENTLTGFMQACCAKRYQDKFVTEALALGGDTLGLGLDYLMETDLVELCKRISQPALVMHGDADIIISSAEGVFLSTLIPKSQLSIVSGEGHNLPLDTVACLPPILEFL